MTEKKRFERSLDIAKSIIEIVAIILGGWWAYDKFIRTEEPALQQNFVISSTVEWPEHISRN